MQKSKDGHMRQGYVGTANVKALTGMVSWFGEVRGQRIRRVKPREPEDREER